jgi:hypothetical protein
MRLTTIINLPVVFLALVIGAAAAPSPGLFSLVEGSSHCFFSSFYLLSHPNNVFFVVLLLLLLLFK